MTPFNPFGPGPAHQALPPLPEDPPEFSASESSSSFSSSTLSSASNSVSPMNVYRIITNDEVVKPASASSSVKDAMNVYSSWSEKDLSGLGQRPSQLISSDNFNAMFTKLSLKDTHFPPPAKKVIKTPFIPLIAGPCAEKGPVSNYDRFDASEEEPNPLPSPSTLKRSDSLELFLSGRSPKERESRFYSDVWNQSNHQAPLSVSPSALIQAKGTKSSGPVSENIATGNYDYHDEDTAPSAFSSSSSALSRKDSFNEFFLGEQSENNSTSTKQKRKLDFEAENLPLGRES